jgi:hypothetical protein
MPSTIVMPKVALVVLVLLGPAGCAGKAASCAPGGALAPPPVTAALQPPPGSTLAMRLHAEGAQVYVCRATSAPAGHAWALKGPDARLYDAACKQVGTHVAGPTWQSSVDGSAVVATKVADAPAEGAIPWLLLKAQKNSGQGVFSRITAIQRVDTTGGTAPSGGCDASAEGKEQAVRYTASYYFYSAAP